jgi:hypothetical protein
MRLSATSTIIVLSTFLTCATLNAQTTAVSQISGAIRDPSGLAVAGAEIRATQTTTGFYREAVSGQDGAYVLPNLPVGPYRFQVTKAGFSAYTQSGIVLQVNINPEVNVTLQVGAVTQNIEVQADAALVETRDSALASVIDEKRVDDMPLNGRQATQLVLLSGAAVSTNENENTVSNKNYPTAVAYSVAGGQGNGTTYFLDGGTNNDFFTNVNLPAPFPDALQEFSVQTNSLPAQYGLHPGAVVNLVTKSGTNEWHGDLFEYLRNGDFNARNFFATRRDTLKRNQFGGVIGAPIRKDKLFFFAGFQGTWNRSDPPVTIAHVPNAAMLAGDFTVAASSACNNKNITLLPPFANNQISPSHFNQQALNFLKLVPVSSDPCGKIQYGLISDNREIQAISRIDYNRSVKHSIFGRYMMSDYLAPAYSNPSNLLGTTTPGLADRVQTLTLGDTYSFSPNLINSFHATGTRSSVNRFPAQGTPTLSQLGVNQYSPVTGQLNVTDSGFFSISPLVAFFDTNVFQIADDVNLIRGSHQISFGVDWIHDQLNNINQQFTNGQWTFNGQATGYGLSDFLLGLPSQFRQGNAELSYNAENYFALYIQDAWKVNRRLAINIGLRWEPYLPPYYDNKEMLHFSMSGFLAGQKSTVFTNAPAGLTFPGDPTWNTGGSFSHALYSRWAPRLGIVYDPTGSGRQTIRASYGIMHEIPELYFDDFVQTGPPWGNLITNTNLPGGFTNPWQVWPGGNPFPPPLPPPKNAIFQPFSTYTSVTPNLPPPYMQQWNLSFQRQFGTNWLATATYLGNKTTHLWVSQMINPAVYIPGTCGSGPCSTVANTNNRRILNLLDPVNGSYYGYTLQTLPGDNASYNGLMLALQHRFSHNYTVLANYTWSHCIDEADMPGEISNANTYQIPNNLKAGTGNCGSDHRQIFNSSFVMQSPTFSSKWNRILLSNWELAPIFTASTGGFATVLTGVDSSLTGVSVDQPNLVGNTNVTSSFSHWFNPAAFQLNAPGTYGNAGRSIIQIPNAWDLDLALIRMVHVRERQTVEIRAEGFNILNHPTASISGLHVAMNDPLFGTINAANDPRILQFSLKYKF